MTKNTKLNYGSLDNLPLRWTLYGDCWLLVDGNWKKIKPGNVLEEMRTMSEDDFNKDFGKLPELPEEAA